jgi:uncharacterized protein YmfQ (DUF2313 family)
MSFLENRDLATQTNILAGYLRNDPLHQAKNREGSNLRKVLIGLASEWLEFRNKINEVFDEYNPNNTTALLEEWETFVGIPDSCISNTGSIEQRRLNILLKLSGINASTAKQFENIAAILGYSVVVETGVDTSTFPLTFPFILMSAEEAPFIIVVTLPISLKPSGFPLTLPFTLGSGIPQILNCLFNKIKPAHTKLYFRYS